MKETDSETKPNKEKSEFISMAVHELKTPIVAIKWILKTVLDEEKGPLNVEQKEAIRQAYDKNENLIKLVEDLIVANKNNDWELKYNWQQINLLDLIKEVVDSFDSESCKRGIDLKFDQPEENLSQVKADPDKIHSVLQNLIENAIKYSSQGDQVTVSVEATEKEIIVSVKDTGQGIPAEDQDKIFQKFFRSKNTDKIPGTGLGLFLVKQIIDRHQGRIWFDSTVEEGSTFAFALPLLK